MSGHLAVLGWHNVERTWCFPARPGAGLRGLERQLAFLRSHANVVGLSDALCALDEGRPLPPRAVAITFDDGYRDTLQLAAPLLERLALPATFFLVPSLLSRLVRPWWEVLSWTFLCSTRQTVTWEGRAIRLDGPAERRLSAAWVLELLKRRPSAARDEAIEQLTSLCEPAADCGDRDMFMDWDDARELVGRGFSVASHSLRHAILAKEHGEEQRRDLALSRRQLEHELGVTVDLLAYPNGLPDDYDQTTMAAAHSAGYAHAVTAIGGWNSAATPPYEIRRFMQQPERATAGLALAPLYPVWRRVRGHRNQRRTRE